VPPCGHNTMIGFSTYRSDRSCFKPSAAIRLTSTRRRCTSSRFRPNEFITSTAIGPKCVVQVLRHRRLVPDMIIKENLPTVVPVFTSRSSFMRFTARLSHSPVACGHQSNKMPHCSRRTLAFLPESPHIRSLIGDRTSSLSLNPY